MTLIVGIQCSDGVVLASDSAATFGDGRASTIGQQEVKKVRVLSNSVLYSSTGAVGMSQLIAADFEAGWAQNRYKNLSTPEEMMNAVGLRISEIVMPYLKSAALTHPFVQNAGTSLCKTMFAIPVKQKPHLFQFDFNGSPEMSSNELPFVALGSGQPIADPFLALLKRLLWNRTAPTLPEGKLVAAWTIQHCAQTNPGGVGGEVQLATLTKDGKPHPAHLLDPHAVVEHLQQISAAEDALVREVKNLGSAPPEKPPAPPS